MAQHLGVEERKGTAREQIEVEFRSCSAAFQQRMRSEILFMYWIEPDSDGIPFLLLKRYANGRSVYVFV